MRLAPRTDANQGEIVAALEDAGCSVTLLSAVGKGCLDLLVGVSREDREGLTVLMEVKDGSKPPSARRLTPAQQKWMAEWKGGPVAIVDSVEAALRVVRTVRANGPHERTKMEQNSPAIDDPLDAPVRPRAWALPILNRFGGGDYLRSTPSVDVNNATGLAWEPLFDRAAIDAAVAVERERIVKRGNEFAANVLCDGDKAPALRAFLLAVDAGA